MAAVCGACAGCGRVTQLGAQHRYRYLHAPGAVLRCSACGARLFVVVELPNGYRLASLGPNSLAADDAQPHPQPEGGQS